jgi:uncharacterized protein YciI
MTIQLERYTITLLVLRPDAPKLDEKAAAALQDAHMSHLADLHEAGRALAGGPLFDDQLRGLNIMRATPEEARALLEEDPAVRIGRLSVKPIAWMVPAGAIQFSRTHFPRSLAEVEGA